MPTINRGYPELPVNVNPDVPHYVNLALRRIDADVELLDMRTAMEQGSLRQELAVVDARKVDAAKELVDATKRLDAVSGDAKSARTAATAAALAAEQAKNMAQANDAGVAGYLTAAGTETAAALAGAISRGVGSALGVDSAALGAAASAVSLASSQIAYEDAEQFVDRWASFTDWAQVGLQTSGGAVYSLTGAGTNGAHHPFPLAAGEPLRLRASVTVPAAGTGKGLTLVGFTTADAAAAPENGWGALGFGVNEAAVPTFYPGKDTGAASAVVEFGPALAPGVYRLTIETDTAGISATLVSDSGETEAGLLVPWGDLRPIKGLLVWNSDSRKLSGASVGALGVRRAAVTVRGADRAVIEGRGPSIVRTTFGTQAVRVALPKNYDSRKPSPLVLFAHGSGGNELTPLEAGRMLSLTTAMQDAGYIVASSYQHGNNWGNDAAVGDLLDLYRKVRDRYAIGSVILMGQSMGGLSSLLTLAGSAVPGIVGYVGIYPVTNLADLYSRTYAGAIRTAYGFTNTADYAAKTAGHDPNLLPAAAFRGVPMRFYASPADTVVPQAANTLQFAGKFANVSAEVTTVPCTGEHGHASHFQPADVIAFLNRCRMR